MTKESRTDCHLFCHRHVLPSCSIRRFDWFIKMKRCRHILFSPSRACLARSHVTCWSTWQPEGLLAVSSIHVLLSRKLCTIISHPIALVSMR